MNRKLAYVFGISLGLLTLTLNAFALGGSMDGGGSQFRTVDGFGTYKFKLTAEEVTNCHEQIGAKAEKIKLDLESKNKIKCISESTSSTGILFTQVHSVVVKVNESTYFSGDDLEGNGRDSKEFYECRITVSSDCDDGQNK